MAATDATDNLVATGAQGSWLGPEPKTTMRPGGTLPSGLLLSKAAIGAGVLTLSTHACQAGMGFTTLMLVVGGILTSISINMIGEASINTKRWSFEDITEELYHWSLSLWTGFVNAVNCIGSAAGYLIVCGQVAQVLGGISDSQRQIFVGCVGTFVCLPLALAKHVSFMRYFAMFSIGALLFLIVAVIYILGRKGVHESVTGSSLWNGSGDDDHQYNIALYVASLNNIVFAYNNQFNVPQIAGELNPRGMKRVRWMGWVSSGMSFCLYFFVSLFGILTFGVVQKDSLVVDFEEYNTDILIICSLLAVGFSVLTCFEMHIYPVRQFLAYGIRKARGLDIDAEESDGQWLGISFSRWLDIVGGVFSVVVAVVIAVKLTAIKQLTDLIGAFASGYIAFVVPPLCLLKIRSREEGGLMAKPVANGGTMLMLLLGIFFVIYGTYFAVKEFKWE